MCPWHTRAHPATEPTRAPPKASDNCLPAGAPPLEAKLGEATSGSRRNHFPLSPSVPSARRRLPALGPAALPRGCAEGVAQYLRGRRRHVAQRRPGVRLRRSPPNYNSREAAQGPPHARGRVRLQRPAARTWRGRRRGES